MRANLLALTLLVLAGCGTLAPGEDPFIVRSEQTIEATADTMEAFMSWSNRNRSILPLDAARVAQHIKENGADYLDSARVSLGAYKTGHADRTTVERALGLLNALSIEITNNFQNKGFR